MTRPRHLLPFLALLALAAPRGARATDYVFSNPAGGAWNTAANWTPSGVPGPGDTATIRGAGTRTVTLSGATGVGRLVLGGGGGTDALKAVAPASLAVLQGAVIDAGGAFQFGAASIAADIEVRAGGRLSATSAPVSGAWTVRSGAVATVVAATVSGPIANDAGGRLELVQAGFAGPGLAVDNHGTVVQSGGNASVQAADPGVVLANAGTWEFAGDGGLLASGGPGTTTPRFSNQGVLRKTAGTGTTQVAGLVLENLGTIESRSGTLRVDDAGNVLRGTWTAVSPGAVDLAGVLDRVESPAFSGTARFVSGLLVLPASGPPAGLALAGGTVRTPAGFQGGSIATLALAGASLDSPLPVSGSLSMNGGNIVRGLVLQTGARAALTNVALAGASLVQPGAVAAIRTGTLAGSLQVAAGGRLEISSLGLVEATLSNAGTTVQSGGPATLLPGDAGSVILNSGIWELADNSGFGRGPGTGDTDPRFENSGILRKTGGTGFSQVVGVVLGNHGSVESASGTILVPDAGPVLRGQWIADAGARIDLGGTIDLLDAPVFSGTGDVRFVSGVLSVPASGVPPGLQLAGGDVRLDPAFQGGSISSLNLAGASLDAVLPVSGSLSMSGGTVRRPLVVQSGAVATFARTDLPDGIDVRAGGKATLSGGTVRGTVNVAAGARLEAAQVVFDEVTLANAGVVATSGFACNTLRGQLGSTFRNDGTWEITGDGGLVGVANAGPVLPRFANNGVVRRVSGANNAQLGGVVLENHGLVEVLSGFFRVDDLGSVLQGRWSAAAGTRVDIAGTFATVAAPEFSGAGTFRFVSGVLRPDGPATPTGLQLVGGTIVPAAGFQGGAIRDLVLSGASLATTLPVSGNLAMTGGSVPRRLVLGAGAAASLRSATVPDGLDIRAGASVVAQACTLGGDIAVAGTLEINQCTLADLDLRNDGTVVQNGQSSSAASGDLGVTIQNFGTWTIAANCGLALSDGGKPVDPVFVNAGTVRKSGGNSIGAFSGIAFDNQGAVECTAGILQFADPGPVLRGHWTAGAGARIDLSGAFAAFDAPVFGGAGECRFAGGVVTLPAGGPPAGLRYTGGVVRLDPAFQGGAIADLVLNGAQLDAALPVAGRLVMTNGAVLRPLELRGTAAATLVNVDLAGALALRDASAATVAQSTLVDSVSVAPGARLALSGCDLSSVVVDNAGTVVQSGLGSRALRGGPGVVILNSGTWDFADNVGLSLAGASTGAFPRFVNSGVVRKSAGTLGASIVSFLFENAGRVECLAGTFRVDDLDARLDGTWTAAAGASVSLAGDFDVVANPTFAGAGTARFVSGILLLPASGVPAGLRLDGGTIRLDPAFQGGFIRDLALGGASLDAALPVAGQLSMSGGGISRGLTVLDGATASLSGLVASGDFAVASGGLLRLQAVNLSGSVAVARGGTLELVQSTLYDVAIANAGTIAQSGFSTTLQRGNLGVSVLNSGTWEFRTDGGLGVSGGVGGVPPRFVNWGLLRKAAGTGTSPFLGIALASPGEVAVDAGRLQLDVPPVFAPSSRVRFTLAGTTPGLRHGQLVLPGVANLDGTLEVAFAPGYLPQPSDAFAVVDYGRPGTPFARVAGEADQLAASYDDSALTVRGRPGLAGLRPPVITSQPAGTNAPAGSTVVLVVVATGSPDPTYQWRRNGQNLPGETLPLLVVPVTGPESGGVYTCVVANDAGAVVSDDAVVTVPAVTLDFRDAFAARGSLPSQDGVGVAANLGATREAGEPLHAGRAGGKSVWIDYLAPATGTLELSTVGSDFDTLLAAYTGTAVNALAAVASDDDSGGFYTSRAKFGVVAGTHYAIAVDGRSGASGHLVLRWSLAVAVPPPPRVVQAPRDALASAGTTVQFAVTAADATGFLWFRDGRPLSDGGRVSGSRTATLTIDAVTPDDAASYRVQVTGNGAVLSTAGSLQLNPAVPAGTTLPQAGAFDKFGDLRDDRNGGFLPSARGRPGLPAALARGTSGTQIFSTRGSASESGEPLVCGVPGGASQWFAFLAEQDGLLTLDTQGSSFDTLLAAYFDDCDDCDTTTALKRLLPLACDTASQPDHSSRLTLSVTNGSIYTICVDGVRGASGRTQLNYRLRPPQPVIRDVGLGASGALKFHVDGPAGRTLRIESSTDLVTWTPARTTTLSAGGFDFSEASPASGARVYRAVFP